MKLWWMGCLCVGRMFGLVGDGIMLLVLALRCHNEHGLRANNVNKKQWIK